MIPDINLIPKLEREQTTSKLVYIILGALTLVALAFFAWQYFSANSSITALQAEQANLQLQRDQLLAKQTELTNTQTNSIDEIIEYVEIISYPVLPLIQEIETLQPNNAYLRSYSFGVDTVSISVDFETLNDVSQYISRLTNSEFFIDAQISNISQFDLGNPTDDDTEETFNVIPRHTTSITLIIDELYLATGGR
ncbi:PilN domain-containing protein [Ureibacillus manganicus]|uniref:Tfp pilus assembly protein PilN n=1 Tax=Ureibacillus manganicus DSM 26584 TaxID=1384049 RepID=A0A0A3IXU8_9BACL|nr:PilN domain-containing protein [Ureibacillus manganicus]KGR79642.1 hypothetical protein CD29_05965 [Ureibacillus manganicus DSM 26584]